ncbi:ABC transporter ATP-binding protein [uncultured Psychroserpens sp.]|uniref:ABC transporter ATP-binding protein n=1 Tax=uncultured Psychroserpens sp. TaxID=255436 RepID=UPI00260ACE49|nr:ABC transporter ATP-binding protein [uncultured Psychroserpens sp.]
MNTLTIQNVSKTYPNGVKALDNINLTISNGMFGLLGANGAGKSSLMRTIAALQKPSSGTLEFNAIDIIETPQDVRKHLGYLPQEFGVYPKISAQKLLDHLAILKGILDKKERHEQVEALLHQTNLYQHRKKSVHTFSGGMKQRFGIAQALLANPQLIIVDEPTAGLDPEERYRFLNLLSEIGENVIVVLSTHIVEDIQELCTQMAVLADGKIISKGRPSDLVKSISGKVWSKIIPKVELDDYSDNYQIISTRLIAGETQIRVLSNSQPNPEFKAVTAGLEDYYFTQMFLNQSSKND